MIRFSVPVLIPIEQFPDQEKYLLESAEHLSPASEQDIGALIKHCNEERVYNRLFKTKLNGKPYTSANAISFLEIAREGWEKKEWFIFVIRNAQSEIVGTIDIFSATLDSTLGYWISEDHPGVMTNAVIAICNLARTVGYHSLTATPKLDNSKSQGVLARAGFTPGQEFEKDAIIYLPYTKNL